MKLLLVACLLAFLPQAGTAKSPRSKAAIAAFKAHNPCPSSGLTYGPCRGFQVDHIQPLCANGPDTRENMQWLSVAAHRAKTRTDIRLCRQMNPCKFNYRVCKL